MLDRIYRHFASYFPLYLWVLVAIAALTHQFTLAINASESLPGTLFLIKRHAEVRKGDLAAFRYEGSWPHPPGTLLLKRVAGVEGSVVTRENGHYFVDGQYVGKTKSHSKTGVPLAPGPVGVIPPGHYYMAAPHPDSMDSRYALVGWVAKRQIMGRAYRIF